jgi:hypothetical protein
LQKKIDVRRRISGQDASGKGVGNMMEYDGI